MGHNRRRGFTVIELLVTIAIIGALVALLMPAVQAARESARRSTCQSRMKQLGLALHNYHDAHNALPPGTIIQRSSSPPGTGWGWGAMVLPYVEQQSLHSGITFETPTVSGSNTGLIGQSLPVWRCPSDTAPPSVEINVSDAGSVMVASGNYCGVDGVLSAMSETRFSAVSDGLTQTLMLGERVYQPGTAGFNDRFVSAWCGVLATATTHVNSSVPYLPASDATPINDGMDSPGAFTSRHPGGAFFAMCDGSVQMISENINSGLFVALGTPAGGEVITLP